MGKALRPEQRDYFTVRLDEHSLISQWELIRHEHEYLFRVVRTLSGNTNNVVVHLTDAYRYGLAEFFARPRQLRTGSFVVIGMPHASAAPEVIDEMKQHRIGIGHIGKFMGALNYRNVWEYMTPTERREEQEQRRRKELDD